MTSRDKIKESYEDEFDERTADLLAYFSAGMHRTEKEGSAATWISGAVNYARWLRSRDMQIEDATQVDADDYIEIIADNYHGTTASGKIDGVFKFYAYLDRKREAENVVEELTREDYNIDGERTRQADALDQQDNYIAISEDEVERLWADDNMPSPRLRNELATKLLWYTGLRASELVSIRIDNPDRFDRSEQRINVWSSKTESYRDVWYPDSLRLLMTEWLDYGGRSGLSPLSEDSPYLFLTQQSEQMRPSHVSRIVKESAQNAGINEVLYVDAAGKKRWKVTGHTLRHSMASYHANILETPIHVLKEILGHQKMETTLQYVQDNPEVKKQAMTEPWR